MGDDHGVTRVGYTVAFDQADASDYARLVIAPALRAAEQGDSAGHAAPFGGTLGGPPSTVRSGSVGRSRAMAAP